MQQLGALGFQLGDPPPLGWYLLGGAAQFGVDLGGQVEARTYRAGRASLPCRTVDIFLPGSQALDLLFGQYVVFGSGPLVAHGIWPTNDVDLFVTTTLYERLKAEGWKEKELDTSAGGLYLSSGIYDADDTWEYGAYNPTPEALIARADVIDGVPFAPLQDVLKWKAAFGRPKDLADIALIRQYLSADH